MPATPESEFAVPVAVDVGTGRIVSPSGALRDTEYQCLECDARVILRQPSAQASRTVRQHFAHRGRRNCAGESALHRAAKLLLVQAISDHIAQVRAVTLDCACRTCDRHFTLEVPSDAFDDVDIERTVGAFRLDVAALLHGNVALGIEVLSGHAVREEKAQLLDMYWIELRAEDVVENQYAWRPVSKRLKPVECTSCKQRRSKIVELARAISYKLPHGAIDRDAGRAPFLPAIEKCFLCKKEILLFWWSEVPFATREPPQPRPKTIQYRYSKSFGGKYWVNTCPHCQVIQGDNYVFLGFNGSRQAFANLPLRSAPETQQAEFQVTRRLIDLLKPKDI